MKPPNTLANSTEEREENFVSLTKKDIKHALLDKFKTQTVRVSSKIA